MSVYGVYASCHEPKNFHYLSAYGSFPKQQILYSKKLKEFADNNFKFDQNGRKFSKRVENTDGKGEIACNEQFLLFPLVFSKDLYCRLVENKDLNGKELTLSQTSPGFYVCSTSLLKTLWEKEKLLITNNFFFFHSVFYPFGEL